jgi:hypothetical protein
VGEEIIFKVLPSLASATWTTTVGNLNVNSGAAVLLTLDDTVGSLEEVTADFLGISLERQFEIVAPTGVEHAKVASTFSGPVGKAGAGMHLFPVIVGPTDVSFYNVQMLEVGQPASNITGYFTSHPPPPHDAAHGADAWFQLDQFNQWPSSYDDAVLATVDVPNPWSSGSFTWDIPAKWKVITPLATSPEHTITGWNQVFSIQTSGTAKVTKFGRWVDRTTGDLITHN